MTIASGANVRVAYYEEVTPNTPILNPVYQEIGVTSESIVLTRDALESETIRPDRQIPDIINGNEQIGGDVPMEIRYGAIDDWLEAALGGTWTTDELNAGVLRRSFNIERYHSDVDVYFRNGGCEMGGFTMEMNSNAINTMAFSIIGLEQTIATTEISGATYLDPVTTEPMNGFTGSISINGLSDACVVSSTITLDNGNEALFCLGSVTAQEQAQSKSRVTGQLGIYFEDETQLTLFNNGTYFEIVIEMSDNAGNSYTFTLPKVKFTSADTSVPDANPLTYTYDISAVYDETSATNISVTRASA